MKNSPKTPETRAEAASKDAPLKQGVPNAPAGSSKYKAPDEGVAGRDRLSENEDRGMDPGISDASHS